jgi:formylglycine-generating enzyme required for sulfatase activity
MPRTLCRLVFLLFLCGLCVALIAQPERGQSAPAPVPRNHFTNSIGMKLVRIPAGKFTMGSPAGEVGRAGDEHQHEVEISRSFFLGVYEVTQAQYEKVMGNNPSEFRAGGRQDARVRGLDTSDFPVENVSFTDAVTFCKKLSEQLKEKQARRHYRLPTEAEWEYACRAGAKEYRTYHYGKSITNAQASFNGKPGRTTKVGSYKPNAWGLYDMHGNVWEWVHDWYDSGYYRTSPKKDPRGPATGSQRLGRGGGYFNDDPRYLRSAHRGWTSATNHHDGLGFRVACDLGAPRFDK